MQNLGVNYKNAEAVEFSNTLENLYKYIIELLQFPVI